MKTVFLAVLVALSAIACVETAEAQVRVGGYYRSNGTYVQPHYRSNPDGNFYNNWSTSPNINPYSGRMGTRSAPGFGSGLESPYRSPYRSSRYGW